MSQADTFPPPEGFVLTHFLVVADQDRIELCDAVVGAFQPV